MVVGGALFTTTVIGVLVAITPPAKEATLWRLYEPLATSVVFHCPIHPK